jgi:hypothetical protein
MTYCFRLRIKLSKRVRINAPEEMLVLSTSADGEEIALNALPGGDAISEAAEVALVGKGFKTEEEARLSGEHWTSVLQRSLARVNIGADFGARSHKGAFTPFGQSMIERTTGGKVLNDAGRLMTYECEAAPRFAYIQTSATLSTSGLHLVDVCQKASALGVSMTERETTAFDLYGASFFLDSTDARFVMLMMAVEALITPIAKSPRAVRYVDQFIDQITLSDLEESEKASLIGSLDYLRSESINQAGRRLVEALGGRKYGGVDAPKFFSRCYEVRSSLVHGKHPRPDLEEVDSLAADLELMVSDLLSGQLLRAQPS